MNQKKLKKLKNKSPRLKLFFLFFLPFVTILLSVSYITHYIHTDYTRNVLEGQQDALIRITGKIISDEFESVVSDLLVLSDNRNLQKYLDTGNKRLIKDLSYDFLSLCKRKKLYDQARFLGENGMENLRINFNNDNPMITDEKNLQNKGKRYYFMDSFSLNRGEIFVSPFDLNIERGKIENPLKPMIRFATPVFDSNKNKKGLVLLNYLGGKLINKIINLAQNEASEIFLVNAQGFWLKGQKSEEEWGFMFETGKNHRFQKTFPETWDSLGNSDSGRLINKEGMFTFQNIYPLVEAWKSSVGSSNAYMPSKKKITAKEYYWKLVSFITPENLNYELDHFFQKLLVNGIIIILIALISWFIERLITHRREAEIAVLEKEKFNGVLEMAGAISHELSQPLQVISLQSSMLIPSVNEDESVYKKIKMINDQVGKIGRITKKLMHITKYKTREYADGGKIIDLN